jgi:hypothetical protein
VPPSRILDSSNVFTPPGSIESFFSQGLQEILDPPMTNSSNALNNLDLDTFSFRWDLGLDCEEEDGSVSDYGTVLHTGETNLSALPTTATGLSAVEEITENGLTDSRTASTTNQRSLGIPPVSDDGLGSLPYRDHRSPEVTKDGKSILDRLLSASERLVPRIPVPWPVPAPTLLLTEARVDPPEKPSVVRHPRPKNKLRKKTRPSISITLAVEPASSFSLAQPPTTSLEVSHADVNPTSVYPVAGFPSARSFFSFELPPVFSKARSKALQKSKYRPFINAVTTANRTSTTERLDTGSSDTRGQTREYGDGISRDGHLGRSDKTAAPDGSDIGSPPAPMGFARNYGQEGVTYRRARRISRWELGLGLGQDLSLRISRLWSTHGRR